MYYSFAYSNCGIKTTLVVRIWFLGVYMIRRSVSMKSQLLEHLEKCLHIKNTTENERDSN